MVLEQLNICMPKKLDLDTDLPLSSQEINLKWIIAQNVKCKIMKLLEDNMGENVEDLGMVLTFNTTAKAQSIKEIIGKLTYQ